MSLDPFLAYSDPPVHAMYSEDHLKSLTFETAYQLSDDLPEIARPGTLIKYTFTDEEPNTGHSKFIQPWDIVPHIQDLQPIIQAMPEMFQNGRRSVVVSFRGGNGTVTVNQIHFIKVQLFRMINIWSIRVKTAADLYAFLVVENPELLSESTINNLMGSNISATMQGCLTVAFPLWKLGYILDETYLEEDVANSLLEVLYFRGRQSQIKASVLGDVDTIPPTFLFPTEFFNTAKILFTSAQTPIHSPELMEIQQHLRDCQSQISQVIHVGFLLVRNQHYVAYFYRGKSSNVEFADSLGGEPDPQELEVIRWALGDSFNIPFTVIKGDVGLQPVFGLGSGSCAFAAHNFLERQVFCDAPKWAGFLSKEFRDCALKHLILYHDIMSFSNLGIDIYIMKREQSPALKMRDLNTTSKRSDSEQFCGYVDFNLYEPLDGHPVEQLAEALEALGNSLPAKIRVWSCYDTTKTTSTLSRGKQSLTSITQPKFLALDSLTRAYIDYPHPQSVATTVEKMQLGLLPAFQPQPKPKPLPHHQLSHPLDSDIIEISDSQSPSPRKPILKKARTMQQHRKKEVYDIATPSPRQGVAVTRAASIEIISPERYHKPLRKFNVERSLSIEMISPPAWFAQPKIEVKPELKGSWIPSNTAASTHPIKAAEYIMSPSVSPKPKSRAPLETVQGRLQVGSFFQSDDECHKAILKQQEGEGYVWVKHQSKCDANGHIKRRTYRCRSSGKPQKVISLDCDPADSRNSKSSKTECVSHINLCRCEGGWMVTVAIYDHNHPPHLAPGAMAPVRPTSDQKAKISRLATSSQHFNRAQLAAVINESEPDFMAKPLEPRQISNMMNHARKEAREEVQAVGGSFPVILRDLEGRKFLHGWAYEIQIDVDGVPVALWWQSAKQEQLVKRFPDILINDNAYNRNEAGYILNIGVIIDNYSNSRNAWYALHAKEDTETLSWVFKCHVSHSPSQPEIVVSDRNAALRRGVREILPLTFHIFCLHHLTGNIAENLRRCLGNDFADFTNEFWAVHRAVSPEHFDMLWYQLVHKYSNAREYLEEEIYPDREHWAWAFVAPKFTAGIRTNGRVESENRVNKTLGGPTTSLKKLYDNLNERTTQQESKEHQEYRQTTRRQHARTFESTFPGPLALIREHAGPHALHTCYQQMEASLVYTAEMIVLPAGVDTWTEYAIHAKEEIGFKWEAGEEMKMINQFANDNAYISTKWLLRQILSRGQRVRNLYRVQRIGASTFHIVAVLENGNYVCDCCMGANAGLPCRHFFQVMLKVHTVKFKIGFIRSRWYKDHTVDPALIPPVGLEHPMNNPDQRTRETVIDLEMSASNPLELRPRLPEGDTQTVDSRTVYHEIQGVLKSTMSGVQTQADLDYLKGRLDDIRREVNAGSNDSEISIHDPSIKAKKGHPRTARITGPLEGRPRGGGARTARKKRDKPQACRECGQSGHNRLTCPNPTNR